MILYIILFIMIKLVEGQLPSPCPAVFSYERREEGSDRWHGQIHISAPKDLKGVWVHIVLDRPADILGNWFGQVSTCDNTAFVIRNPDYVLQADYPFKQRFFVKFNKSKQIPTLVMISLNGNVICASKKASANKEISDNSVPTERDHVPKPETPVTKPRPGRGGNNFDISFLDVRTSPVTPPSYDIDVRSSCGVVAPTAKPLIINGQGTVPGEYPWHAALYHIEGIKIAYKCGATLISDQYVLTAAHCLYSPSPKTRKDTKEILISLGKYDLTTWENLLNRGVSKIFIHPEYNLTLYYNDIAVLKLTEPVKVTNFIRPCCLWQGDSRLDTIKGQEGTVVGWGFNEERKISYKLMKTKMPVVLRETCIFNTREIQSFLFDKNYCAGFTNGHSSACTGDSGGGMVFPRETKTGQITWHIRGIVSLSLVSAGQTCESMKYNVFTDVAQYTNWITSIINNKNN